MINQEVSLKCNVKPTALRFQSTTGELFRISPDGKVTLGPDINTDSLKHIQTPFLQFLQEIISQELEKRKPCQQ